MITSPADGANASAPSRWQILKRWLLPGLGVKRWLFLMVLATALLGISLAILFSNLAQAPPETSWLSYLSLRALPLGLRVLIFGASGLALLIFAGVRLNRALLAPFVRPGKTVVDAVAEHRRLGRGPRIVALGGGTGLSTLLRGLKQDTGNLTAIVTVADDGGSSGRLRRSLGLPPPGDLRACLAALSDDEDLLTQLFQYRFLQGEELDGHSFGNLFIAALAGVTGSFDRGILEAGRVLAIRGQVVPATLTRLDLVADKMPSIDVRPVRVEGESRIPTVPGRIRRLQLKPNDPPAYPEAIHALLNAEMIVIGPGSLYTSILPNLLVPDIARAIRSSRAFKVFVCNVATQPGETDGYDAFQHLAALEEHVGSGLVDVMLLNDRTAGALPEGVEWVGRPANGHAKLSIYLADLVDDDRPWRHDSRKLAETLVSLLEERTGPLQLPPLETLEPVSGLN